MIMIIMMMIIMMMIMIMIMIMIIILMIIMIVIKSCNAISAMGSWINVCLWMCETLDQHLDGASFFL